jgi:hypothetical protein
MNKIYFLARFQGPQNLKIMEVVKCLLDFLKLAVQESYERFSWPQL